MFHEILTVGPLQCNCSVLACEKTGEAVVIDPGDEGPRIAAFLASRKLKVKYLLHTHAHFDHIGATGYLKAATDGMVTLHRGDQVIYEQLPMQGQMFGFQFKEPPPIEKFVEEGDVLEFSDYRCEVLHTPGHSPGSVCFKVQEKGTTLAVFSGDTLFRRSIGRADLWGGNQGQLLESISQKLFSLEPSLNVFPGHGAPTTIQEERRENPFF